MNVLELHIGAYVIFKYTKRYGIVTEYKHAISYSNEPLLSLRVKYFDTQESLNYCINITSNIFAKGISEDEWNIKEIIE
jgi:hypothetical protein